MAKATTNPFKNDILNISKVKNFCIIFMHNTFFLTKMYDSAFFNISLPNYQRNNFELNIHTMIKKIKYKLLFVMELIKDLNQGKGIIIRNILSTGVLFP